MELKKVVIESLLALLLIAIIIFLFFNLISYLKSNSETFQLISSSNINISRAYVLDNQLIIVIKNKFNEEIPGVVVKTFDKNGEVFSTEFKDKLAGSESKSLTLDPSPFGAINNYQLIQVISQSEFISAGSIGNESYVIHNNDNNGKNIFSPINTGPASSKNSNDLFDSNKICTKWEECINDIQKRTCINSDFIGKKQETRDCSSKSFQESSFHDVPVKKECKPDFQCGEWSSCKDYYNLEDITNKDILLAGYRERTCSDKNQCSYDKTEHEPCENSQVFLTKTSGDETKEIMSFYDSDKNEILNLTFNKFGKSLDINIVFNEVQNNKQTDIVNFSIYGKKISYSLIIIFIFAIIIIIFLIIRFYKNVFLVLSRTNKK